MRNAIDWTGSVGDANAKYNYFWSRVIPWLENETGHHNPAVLTETFPTEEFTADLTGENTVIEFYSGERYSWDSWVVRDTENRLIMYTFFKHGHATHVCVYSPHGVEDAEMTLLEIEQRIPARKIPENEWVNVAFWTQRPDGASTYHDRRIVAPDWADVDINYPRYARNDLSDVHGWETPPLNGGRLMLLHGPPGTGKTNLIRSIARAWKQWCTMHYVVDPENFFGNAHYMMSVLLDGDAPESEMWRLVIVEDADELLSIEAKTREGQNVSRLLNVCDGLVGQGLRVLVLLTSNEPLSKMHPAIIRPGRCVANLNIGKLFAEDANEWRRAHSLAPATATQGKATDLTLAELYEELRQTHVKTTAGKVPLGFGT